MSLSTTFPEVPAHSPLFGSFKGRGNLDQNRAFVVRLVLGKGSSGNLPPLPVSLCAGRAGRRGFLSNVRFVRCRCHLDSGKGERLPRSPRSTSAARYPAQIARELRGHAWLTHAPAVVDDVVDLFHHRMTRGSRAPSPPPPFSFPVQMYQVLCHQICYSLHVSGSPHFGRGHNLRTSP